jgi:TonB family protein
MAVNHGPPDSEKYADLPRRFTTKAQIAERRDGRRRIIWAIALTLASLVVFILLGPDADTVKKRFEYYGAPGEMQIMPEVSIDDGQDQIRQLPKSLQTPPPPSRLEIEPEDLSENATETVPEPSKDPVNDVINDNRQPTPDAEMAASELVEMSLPMQSNPDFFIISSIIPQYPLTASEIERRVPVIFVVVNLFVNSGGRVTDTLIQATNGSRVYEDAVVEAVLQWEFGWRVPRESGGWITTRINFNSPYFSQTGSGF